MEVSFDFTFFHFTSFHLEDILFKSEETLGSDPLLLLLRLYISLWYEWDKCIWVVGFCPLSLWGRVFRLSWCWFVSFQPSTVFLFSCSLFGCLLGLPCSLVL